MLDPDPMRRPNVSECLDTVKLFLAEEEKQFCQPLKSSPAKKDTSALYERADDLFTDHGAVKFERAESWEAHSNILSKLLGSQQTINSVHLKSPMNSNSSKIAGFGATGFSGRLNSPSPTNKLKLKFAGQVPGTRVLQAPRQANQIRLEIGSNTPQSLRVSSHPTKGLAAAFSEHAANVSASESPDQKTNQSESPDQKPVSRKLTAEEKITRRGLRLPSGFKQAYLNKGKVGPPQTDLEDDENGTNLNENCWISGRARLMNNSQSSLAQFKLKKPFSRVNYLGRSSAGAGTSNQILGLGANLRLSAYPNPIGLAKCDEEPMPEEC